jgi:hypothetical protein
MNLMPFFDKLKQRKTEAEAIFLKTRDKLLG